MCLCWGLLNNIARKGNHLKKGSFEVLFNLSLLSTSDDFYYYTLTIIYHTDH